MEFLDAALRRVAPLSGDGENQSGDVDEGGNANSSLTRESRKQSDTPKFRFSAQ